jgi:hypothetical protein
MVVMIMNKRLITALTLLIVILSLTAVLTALLYKTDSPPFEVQTVRGESVEIQGSGLYKYDSKSMAAQAIAQDWITLTVGIPLLILSLVYFNKGRFRGRLLLAGTIGYFLYTYTTYAFLSAFNILYLVYVAIFSISLFSFILVLKTTKTDQIKMKIAKNIPRRSVSVYLLFLGIMLLFLWLGRIIPAHIHDQAPFGLDIYSAPVIQSLDLGVIVPLCFISAVLLWKRSPWGYLLTAIMMIKGFTLFLAIVSMIVGQIHAGVEIHVTELVLFPVFAVIGITMTIMFLSGIQD